MQRPRWDIDRRLEAFLGNPRYFTDGGGKFDSFRAGNLKCLDFEF